MRNAFSSSIDRKEHADQPFAVDLVSDWSSRQVTKVNLLSKNTQEEVRQLSNHELKLRLALVMAVRTHVEARELQEGGV